MTAKVNAGCLRTGMCCKRLPAQLGIKVSEYRELYQGTNMTPEFFTGWGQAAKQAKEAGSILFTCPFYSDEKGCGLQDRKPKICSDSLSEAAMATDSLHTKPAMFFSGKCGWLRGAPKEMVDAVAALEAYNDAKNRKAPGPECERLLEERIKADNILAETYSSLAVKDGQWVSMPSPGNEKAGMVSGTTAEKFPVVAGR